MIPIHQLETCAACHAAGKSALNVSCGTAGCHSGSDSVVFTTGSHNAMGDAHASYTEGNCNNCHNQCNDSWCHESWQTQAPPFGYDLPAIHAAQGFNCNACHTPGSKGINDCYGGSCHFDMSYWDDM